MIRKHSSLNSESIIGSYSDTLKNHTFSKKRDTEKGLIRASAFAKLNEHSM